MLEIIDPGDDVSTYVDLETRVHSADAFILLYAINDVTSIDTEKEIREDILSVGGDNVQIIVVGNKSDLSWTQTALCTV